MNGKLCLIRNAQPKPHLLKLEWTWCAPLEMVMLRTRTAE
jgi:hypothetical protein